jgi:hypothetical protein
MEEAVSLQAVKPTPLTKQALVHLAAIYVALTIIGSFTILASAAPPEPIEIEWAAQ